MTFPVCKREMSKMSKMGLFVKFCRLATNSSSRSMSTVNQQFKIMYNEPGDPTKVLHSVTRDYQPEISAKYGQNYVLIKMLAAPVNPADINMIQGVYPIKPELPAVGGNEGCGIVIDKGGDVTKLAVGDHVLPRISGWGTWRRYGIGFEDEFLRVPKDISPVHAAMLSVNPCTAYRLINDFAKLNPGDIIMQNAGNSGVGQCVIQLARNKGFQTISIIRDRPDKEVVVNHLKSLGADYIVVERGNEDMDMKHLMSHMPKAKLALNCVGGKGSVRLFRYMDKGSTLVTYGGMSKMPMMVPAGPLIFDDIRLFGFWMTRWNKENLDTPEYNAMWKDIFGYIKTGALQIAKHNLNDIEDYKSAIAKTVQPHSSEKQVLVLDKALMKR